MQQSYKDYKVIVVDHGSTDGTSEYITKKFPDVIVLKGDESMWWTAATNLGVKYAIQKGKKEDWILTLNNDLVVGEKYLETLVYEYHLNKPCLVGSICIDFDDKNRVEDVGCKWNRFNAKHVKLTKIYDTNYANLLNKHDSIDTDVLSGRGVLIPFGVFNEIGLYDEKKLPHYGADNDFSIRAKNAGYKLIISVKSSVYAHLKETGVDFNRKISYKVFIKSLFSINSSTNLKTRYYFAMKHSPIKGLYFIIDVIRVILSFHISLIKTIK
jgi:GT2 family glycosyltransferase